MHKEKGKPGQMLTKTGLNEKVRNTTEERKTLKACQPSDEKTSADDGYWTYQ